MESALSTGVLKKTLPSGTFTTIHAHAVARANVENPRAGRGLSQSFRQDGRLVYSETTRATSRESGSTITTSLPDTMNR
jgi:hypothetical protein